MSKPRRQPVSEAQAPPAAPPAPCCQNCHHWRPGAYGRGECHAHPPTPVVAPGGIVGSLYPPTPGTDLCGEYRPLCPAAAA